MTVGPVSPATFPPAGLPGLDVEWSRLVTTPELDGEDRTWHVLDNRVENASVTLLCVHGNPTWSYLWRDLLASAPHDVRVVAVDQLNMGFSERTGVVRRLAQRIDDLSALTEAMELTGPVVTVAHDWGGPISLGWAQRHTDQLAGIVLGNTAVHQPEGSRAPSLIRLVRTPGLLKTVCESTLGFVRGTTALSRPRPSREIRAAYESPYLSADRRSAIADFVEDIPLTADHPSYGVLNNVAAGLDDLRDVPALLLWGPSDPVFSDLYLHDFEERLPDADVHRFIGASHLVPEDAELSGAVFQWLERADVESAPTADTEPLLAAISAKSASPDVAIVEMGPKGQSTSVTFSQLHADIDGVAIGLMARGVAKGDRIAILVPPGIDLAVSIFAAWKVGAVVVLVDAGLGLRGIGHALASANPTHLIGIPKALLAARTLRWPGERLNVPELRTGGDGAQLPEPPGSFDVAGIGFTSGATGPAKGVVYRHHQMQAQRDAIKSLYNIGPSDSLVAAFGPFALFGPLLGIPSVVPDMEVTSPGTLTASALADAVAAVDATLVFGSPAALRNVAATADDLTDDQLTALRSARLLLSAGAPVNVETLRAAASLMPNAEAHTPYGMTEAMPVADIDLEGIVQAGDRSGVCVGLPVEGVEVAISETNSDGQAVGALGSDPGVVGEVCIRTAHMRDGYDKLWVTQDRASQPAGWHRTGDIGHLDDEGRLWIEGRIGHVVTTADGPVTPVGLEHAIESHDDVALAAVVGVGPVGTQQIVAVLEMLEAIGSPGLAPEDLADQVRDLARTVDIAAVFVVPELPVDKRHNSKINRGRIATWAEAVLAGGRLGRL